MLPPLRLLVTHSYRVRDIKVDGREAPIRAATVRERMPAAESANAPSRSRLCLAVGCTPGFLRLAGIWANRLTSMSRTRCAVIVLGSLATLGFGAERATRG